MGALSTSGGVRIRTVRYGSPWKNWLLWPLLLYRKKVH